MRDYILLFINGVEHRVRGEHAFLPLTDYLRYVMAACGTKVVCAEGDCGACTVAIGKLVGNSLEYSPVNGCIQYMYQLDCSHVITVEGVRNGEELSPVQATMVDCHGAQCGYCTPGFIMAMCSMFDCGAKVDRPAVKEALSGNLCRCTGYVSIIEAALAVDAQKFFKFNQQYPNLTMVEAFQKHVHEPAQIEDDGRVVSVPAVLDQAVAFKKEHPGATIISGGTDVCVNMNKRAFAPQFLLSTGNLPDLSEVKVEGNRLEVGARVTLRTLEKYVKELIPELYKVLFVFGSPQIRYAGTLAGNIANASPIADTLPFLYVMGAELEVVGSKGRRRIKIDSFYKGYKVLALEPDEMITHISIPVPAKDEILKLFKVSKREHLDISSFAAAVRLKNLGGKIKDPVIAYGGVGPMIIRLKKTEAFLQDKPFSLETFSQAGPIARDEITPISDVRGTKDFRYQLAENILVKFYYETIDERQLVCQ